MQGPRDVLENRRQWHVETCDVLDGLRSLPDGCVHCCVTSPPYWGLRDYGMAGQLGLEPTPAEYVTKMVEVFSEVRRVLRPDGTFWLNIGDSYAAGKSGRDDSGDNGRFSGPRIEAKQRKAPIGYKPKDLVGIPRLLAFALRADGWYLRSEIIWHKRAPMPESVTDRPTKAHEQVFLFAKSQRYFYDAVASAEPASPTNKAGNRNAFRGGGSYTGGNSFGNHSAKKNSVSGNDGEPPVDRNMRSVWTLSPESFSGAHFATMPTELVRKALLAGTSERGCCALCGAPWKRLTEKDRKATRPGTNSKVNRAAKSETSPYHQHNSEIVGNRDPQRHTTVTTTVGWKAGCDCETSSVPCVVLDPFNGAATTGVVARRLGLRYIGFELNPEYAAMARKRIVDDAPLLNSAG